MAKEITEHTCNRDYKAKNSDGSVSFYCTVCGKLTHTDPSPDHQEQIDINWGRGDDNIYLNHD